MEIKYENIYLFRYHNGERDFKNERVVYDNFEVEELFGEEEAKIIAKLFFDKANIKERDNTSITRITLNVLDLDNELKKLQNELYEHFKTLGADGDTFDYFPDIVIAFQQICVRFNKKEIFNNTVKVLNEEEYDDIGEPFEELK